jgi:hypothetical protein
MAVKMKIPFEDLLTLVSQLQPEEKERLQQELVKSTQTPVKLNSLSKLLLKGPVFTEEQIAIIEENRQSINEWRTVS